jgi:CheY-like chemotaxis protein
MTQNSTKTVIDLPATLYADAAPALIAEIKTMDRAGEVRLNAAAVTSLSPGYLQILISAFKTFPQMTVSDASAAFVEGFALCGLTYPVSPSLPEAATAESVALAGECAIPTAVAPDELPGAPIPVTLADAAADVPPEVPADEPPSATVAVAPVGEPSRNAAAAAPAAPSDTGMQAEPDTPQASGTAMPKTILTIDDSRTMRDMLKMALGGAGFTVLQAVDGQDGLNVLAKQTFVDLIITDINMPKLDGYGVIRAVRKDPIYNETPILVLSTEGEQESKDIAKDAGATGWIVKPFDPDGLVKIVNTVCG